MKQVLIGLSMVVFSLLAVSGENNTTFNGDIKQVNIDQSDHSKKNIDQSDHSKKMETEVKVNVEGRTYNGDVIKKQELKNYGNMGNVNQNQNDDN